MSKNLKLVDVAIMFDSDYPDDLEEVVVAIGDGKTKFDENYDFDSRVYFYFDNQAQFDQARVEELEDVGFKIMTVLDE
jgi:hypothetical protein